MKYFLITLIVFITTISCQTKKNLMKDKPNQDGLVLKSNYIFSIITKKLKANNELYNKWYLAGAFNGILFNLPDEKYVEISCFDYSYWKEYSNLNLTNVKLDDMIFTIHTNSGSNIIKELIKKGEKSFNKLSSKDKKNDIIRKLYFSITIAPNKNKEELKNRIIKDLSNILNPKTFEVSNLKVCTSQDGNYEFNLSFYLEEISQENLVKLLKPYFPNIHSPLLQLGYICANHTVPNCIEQELFACDIIGRQF